MRRIITLLLALALLGAPLAWIHVAAAPMPAPAHHCDPGAGDEGGGKPAGEPHGLVCCISATCQGSVPALPELPVPPLPREVSRPAGLAALSAPDGITVDPGLRPPRALG